MKTANALAAAILVAGGVSAAWAQMTPVGTWRSVDDKTGEAKSEIQITENGGVMEGHVLKILRKDATPDSVCTECKDKLKDHKLIGLPVITGAKKAEGKDVWEGGKILDPESGKTYTLRLTPVEDGKKLEVRGSIGPFGRTQTWQRVQ